MDIYIQLSQEYFFIDSEKSVEFAKKAWEIAILNNVSVEKKHNTIYQLGQSYLVSGDYSQTIQILKEALTDNAITDTIKIKYYNSLGIANHKIEDYTNALLYGHKAIRLSDSLNIPERSIASMGTMAAIYTQQENYTEALNMLNKSLSISSSGKGENQLQISAYAYKDIAFVHMKLNQIDASIAAATKAIDIAKKNKYLYIESDARNNLSRIYLNQSNLNDAITEALNAKKIALKVKANKLILEANMTLIDCYLEMNQLTKANTLANEMLKLATELDLKTEIIDAYQYISTIASKNNKHKKAYETQLKIATLLDHRYETEKQRYFQLTEEKINRAQEDALIQKMKEEAETDKMNLRKSKAFGIIMTLIFLFTLLLSFIFYRYGVFQKQFPKTSFFKNDQEVRLQYIKQTSTVAQLLNIPLLLYFYLWENYSGFVMAALTSLIILIVHFFARAKKINYIFAILLLLYIIGALSPISTGPIYSVLILHFALFLVIHFLKPEPGYQIINSLFAILSVFLFFYFVGNYPTSKILYSADLELIIGSSAFLIANMTLYYFYKNINDYKEELLKKNNFLNQISDINPHLIFAKDKNRKFTFANKVISESYNLPKSKLIGKQYEELENYNPDWAIKVKEEEDLNILNNSITILEKEQKIKDLDGNDTWIITTKKPILNKENEVEGILGVAINVTEIKLQQEQIKESENRYRELFNLSFDGLFIVDLNGEILEINDSAKSLFGVKKEDYSKVFSDYIPNIEQIVHLKEFHKSILYFSPPIRINGKNESNEIIPLEMSMFKIQYFEETKIAFAFKNISTQLILQKKEQEIELQKRELESLNKEFVSQEIFANTKNKLLSEIKNDVAEIIPIVDGKGKQELNKLIRKIGSNINDEENFFSFKLKFDKSHPEFFNTLNQLNPKLTNNDLKLCAYMRLGMTSLDIANLQFIERKSVEMTKYRLKKKLQLESKDDLNTFIQEI